MANKEISKLLRELHHSSRLPYLEIEGEGELSVETRYLKLMEQHNREEGEVALYVIKNFYEEGPFITSYDTKHLRFQKSEIESLVREALESKDNLAIREVRGKCIEHYESWDDYSGSHSGSPKKEKDISIKLSLSLGEKPQILVEY